MDGARSPGRSVGVEEEFLLVDPVTGDPCGRAESVLAVARRGKPAAADAALHAELATSQVEAATGRCLEMDQVRTQLCHGRRQLALAAREQGVWLVSSGAPVLDGQCATVADGDRFARVASSYAGLVGDYQACGCHVHVGVPDRDTAVAVVNHLRPWLPTLLALAGNSPFHRGYDTGYASWRMVEQWRFPGAGIPPWFPSSVAYDRQIADLVECGVLVDDRMTFWLARPSPHLPTVELRVADAAIGVGESTLQAALSRGLVRTALDYLALGREAPPLNSQVAAAALWSAARYGLDGPGIHPIQQRRLPAIRLVEELLEIIAPALEDTGDLRLVRGGIAALSTSGTGARRQRSAARHGPFGVVRMLAAESVDPFVDWQGGVERDELS